ncbi:Cystathionine beta-lyase/cystathionine gamma-synthase [Roseovarius mucosus DSM 17069]|uniref:Cystathionine beta-lyase/cystathionine gamma-synthase n=1 Tax=Roseovarius mucosus DSM 17069 TaxID=1288298 RepID=A0A0A0HNS0_9RHOB|nr:aminotransferase class I/II-fold pyridoxal phosphate-dependent enzyme [Roseovarius mucosus]KGM88586.1 Cystathionine beta-lyase/cystathionine gamma-synthase [Roseovarius mucosus DSM 17069]
MKNEPLKPATIAAQAAGAKDTATGGVVPGISLATTYTRGADYALLRPDNMYGRDQNDTVRQAEEVIRQLEGAAATLLFPSGMAAVAAVFRALPSGARVVMQTGIYWGTLKWVRAYCVRRAILLDEIDASDPAALAAACRSSADMVWIETPSNPWLKTVEIATAAGMAHKAGAILVVDGTAATPVLTRALDLGADIVMHSGTKALNGHSDVLAGVLSCREPGTAMWQEIVTDRHDAGAVMGPFEAWLLMRGMRTLPLRMERMCENALAVARYLEGHAQVETVLYPGLESHAGHAIATRQMCGGYGYLLSAVVAGGRERALQVAGRLQLLHRATSLGGVESLVEHRHTIEPHTGIPEGLLRFSVGIEDAGDLIADLAQALDG